MKRVTVFYFTWDWTHLLGKRAVDLPDELLADAVASDRFVRGLMRSVVANPPAHIHGGIALGTPSEVDLCEAVPQLMEKHQNGSVRKTESWEL